MTWLSAIIMGLVQGIAEFLPISSSGHLAIAEHLLNMQGASEIPQFYDVLLHLGTLVAVFIAYWDEIYDMIVEFFAGVGDLVHHTTPRVVLPARRMILLVIVGTLPLFLVLPINDKVEELYYITPFIGAALLLTGCVLFVSDKMAPGTRTERNMRFRDALTIGLCQCVATIPGLSRSGTTITAGIATGLDRTFAMKYSFLLSLPAVLGANLLSFIKAIGEESIEASLIPAYLLGMLAAMLSGIAAISLMKLIAKKSKFGWFAYYCWGAGVLTIILSLIF